MTEKQITFGEFVDMMEKLAEGISIDAEFYIEELRTNRGQPSEEQWKELCNSPLTPELVVQFAEYLSSRFKERLDGICTDELYTHTKKEAHEFLQKIHEKAAELGIQLDIKQIDVPLTPSDLMAAAGLAEIKDGKIRLSPEGERLAMEVEKEFATTDE